MTESFRIPYPASPKGKSEWSKKYGMNAYYSGKHWSQRKEDAEYWHYKTLAAMQKYKCRKTPFERPVIISFRWNDKLDLDNHAVMAKMIVDAMKGRMIKDDSRKYLVGVEHYFHDADFISVTVMETGIEPVDGEKSSWSLD